jgi:hypothetical protein
MYLPSFDEFVKENTWKDFIGAAKTFWETIPGYVKWPAVTIGGITAIGAPLGFPGVFGGEKTRQSQTLSYLTNKALFGLADRIRLDEVAAEAFTKSLASGSATELLGLTKDVVSKNYENIKTLVTSPARKELFEEIRRETPELMNVPLTKLQEAYHTMVKFAPTLAQDKNAVKSFLTQAAVSATGIDYNAIRGIAEAERSINNAKGAK